MGAGLCSNYFWAPILTALLSPHLEVVCVALFNFERVLLVRRLTVHGIVRKEVVEVIEKGRRMVHVESLFVGVVERVHICCYNQKYLYLNFLLSIYNPVFITIFMPVLITIQGNPTRSC